MFIVTGSSLENVSKVGYSINAWLLTEPGAAHSLQRLISASHADNTTVIASCVNTNKTAAL
jgi:hypothetical protein